MRWVHSLHIRRRGPRRADVGWSSSFRPRCMQPPKDELPDLSPLFPPQPQTSTTTWRWWAGARRTLASSDPFKTCWVTVSKICCMQRRAPAVAPPAAGRPCACCCSWPHSPGSEPSLRCRRDARCSLPLPLPPPPPLVPSGAPCDQPSVGAAWRGVVSAAGRAMPLWLKKAYCIRPAGTGSSATRGAPTGCAAGAPTWGLPAAACCGTR